MKIGIDISQIVYEGTGVARYVNELVNRLLKEDAHNEYVLFGASLRKREVFNKFYGLVAPDSRRVRLVALPLPPTFLELLWNRLHIIPVEWFIGNVDVFWSSDWTQPPLARARGITTIHDMVVYEHPEETHPKTEVHSKHLLVSSNIVAIQKRRLEWVKKECAAVLCDSLATKNDVIKYLHIESRKLFVIYPGFSAESMI
jgi:hypothetical protein